MKGFLEINYDNGRSVLLNVNRIEMISKTKYSSCAIHLVGREAVYLSTDSFESIKDKLLEAVE